MHSVYPLNTVKKFDHVENDNKTLPFYGQLCLDFTHHQIGDVIDYNQV